ncbi:MAG: NAD(P)H-binding protein [Pseudomonadota bacterium]
MSAKSVFVLGGTGTSGRAAVQALLAAGHRVTCLVRPGAGALPAGATRREGLITTPETLVQDGMGGEQFDAVLSCLASRTGAPEDAWAVDYQANSTALAAAKLAGIGQMVLLSAICVQRPKLAFQHAKLAFEAELQASGLACTIVRPTAFFKSLSGQVERVRDGKPFLVFGDGRLTACKPISDADLGRFLVHCLEDPSAQNRILPIGGPGPGITPLDQGALIFELLGETPRYRRVPVVMMSAIIGGLGLAGRFSAKAAAKAELARIGRYYATESMLVWDPARARYDADATPEFGQDTLRDHYARMLSGEITADLGAHAVF